MLRKLPQQQCKPVEQPLTLADARARCSQDLTAQLLVPLPQQSAFVRCSKVLGLWIVGTATGTWQRFSCVLLNRTAAAAWHRLTAASSFPVRYFLMRRAALICVGLTAGSLDSGPPRLLQTK